jgi:hypothetical protein
MFHCGLRVLPRILNLPVGVRQSSRPSPTGKVCTTVVRGSSFERWKKNNRISGMFTTTPSYEQQGSTHSVGSRMVEPAGGTHGSMYGLASMISFQPRSK